MHTYLILGHTYSLTERVNVTFKIDDTTIFSGEITALPTYGPERETTLTELCRWTTDIPLQGDLSISGNVSGGDLFFALIAQLVVGDVASEVNQEWLTELEYPDSRPNCHAVTNLNINGLAQPVPVNITKPDMPGDIRGWHYQLPDGCYFDFNYNAGPFEDNA